MLFINDTDKRIVGADAQGKPYRKPVPQVVDITRREIGRIYAAPGETVNVPDWAARPGRGTGGGRTASVIENLCPQLRPADPKDLAAWEKVPEAVTPARRKLGEGGPIPSVEELVAAGMPAGAARAKISKLMAERSLEEQGEEDSDESTED